MPYKDPEKAREQKRQWANANKEKRLETYRRWREVNPERARENDRRKREVNPQRYKEQSRQWANANREKKREASRRWNKTHPEQKRALTQARRANKRGALPTGRCVSAAALQARRALFNYRCAWCIDGLAEQDDHVVPLALGGLHVPENIVPSCARCNCRKSASPPEQWYLLQPFFSQERWALICMHTNLQPSGAKQLTLELEP